jgi:hypothetical protein
MFPHRKGATLRSLIVVLCTVSLLPGDALAYAPPAWQTPASAPNNQASKIPPDQLDSLVAPVALYPDPMLAQVLAASTYPLEIVQLQQWLEKNSGLKDQALADAVAKQPWDPSVQALAALPDLVNRLANDIRWTTDLGNAFLAQQSDVMDAVQRMRKKAQDKGTLKSTEQQTVETKVVESKSVIVIEQANPQVVYVPTYDPVVVYGPPIYPYPPIYYPPAWYYPAGLAISFGVGVMMGAFWSGGWCCGCGWGGGDITINRNNNFNRASQLPSGPGIGNRGNLGNRPSQLPSGGGNRGNLGNRPSQLPAGGAGPGGDRWQHNPAHRGGTPYQDRATADRFGGTTRGDSLSMRQTSARQQLGRQGGNVSNRAGSAGFGNRAGGGGLGNRSSGGLGNRTLGGGPDRIGSQNLSRSGGGNRDVFGGGARGFSGSNARASSSRGSFSAGSPGGGFGGGGGARGGGRRR